ncbi:MAG: hypothetical protein K2I37_03055 [Muribaculaceae bacterium]|nr:hypothetical protein [Muribaculaceae bacterium]
MKYYILSGLYLLSTLQLFGATSSDSLHTCFDKIQASEASIQILQLECNALKSEVKTLNSTIAVKTNEIDSLKSELVEINNSVATLADSLNINISSTRKQIQTSSDSLNATIAKKSQTGLWIFIAIAIVLAVIAFVFGRLIAKRGNQVSSLAAKADKLNEEIVNRLSSEMSEIQTLSKQLGSLSTATGGGTDTEQKLITTLADRITFMEMTLYKMDSSVRGHKQLSKSIKQMKDNLLANGYELVEMLGKDYHDGMKVTANFVEDENLPEGKQVITGIIKPQINYKGKMIQSAQITVSQNL